MMEEGNILRGEEVAFRHSKVTLGTLSDKQHFQDAISE